MKPPTNYNAIVAAGGWHLSTAFLSAKAKAQLRDKHGRFIKMNSLVRWLDVDHKYRWGKVVGTSPDGKDITVHESGKTATAKIKPKQVEVVKALIPKNPAEAKALEQAFGHQPSKPGEKVPDVSHLLTPISDADVSSKDNPLYVDTAGFKKVGGQSGSNPGGVYQGPKGEQYYIKKAQTEQHAANEVLTARLYKEAGVNVPEVYLTEFEDGSPAVASKIVPDLKPMFPGGQTTPIRLGKARAGFAMDAWLANWDSVGLGYDNLMMDKDQNPVRVDTGGGLLYRAQGSPKGGLFGDTVGETETLRDAGMNPQAAKIFGGMSNQDVSDAIAATVNKVSDEDISDLVDELPFSDEATKNALKAKLKARKADLNTKFNVPAAPEPVKDEPKAVIPDAPDATPDAPDFSTKPPGDPYGYTEMSAADVKAGDWVRYNFGHKNTQSFMALKSFEPGDKYLTVSNENSLHSTEIPVNAGTKLPVYKPPVGGLPKPQPVEKNLDGTIPTMAINLNKGDLIKVKGDQLVELDSKFSTGKGVTGKYVSGLLTGGTFQQKAHKSTKFSVLDPDSVDYKAAKAVSAKTPETPAETLKDAPDVLNGDFSTQEFDALDEYTGDAHAPINKYLRGGLAYGMAEEDIEEIADHLFTAIHKSKVQNDSVVYRGISDEDFDLEPGSIMHDAAFVSTSASLEKAKEFSKFGKGPGAVFEIDLPKGSNAVDVTKAGLGGYGEKEFLLNRDSLFEITDVKVLPDGGKYIKATYLPGGPGGGKPNTQEVHGNDSGGAPEGVPGASGLDEGPGHGDAPEAVTPSAAPDLSAPAPLDEPNKSTIQKAAEDFQPGDVLAPYGSKVTTKILSSTHKGDGQYQIQYQTSSNQVSNLITLEGYDNSTFGTLVKGADAPNGNAPGDAADEPSLEAAKLKPGDKVAYGSKTWTVKSVAPGTGPNAGKTIVDLGGGDQVFPNDYKFGEHDKDAKLSQPMAKALWDKGVLTAEEYKNETGHYPEGIGPDGEPAGDAPNTPPPPAAPPVAKGGDDDLPHPSAKIGAKVTSKKDGFSGKVIKVNPNSGYSLVQSDDGSKKLWRKWDTLEVAKDESSSAPKSSSKPMQDFFDTLPEGLDLPDNVLSIFNKMGFLDDINIGEENTADQWVTNAITDSYADGDLETGDAIGHAYDALKKDAGIEDGFQWDSPGSNAGPETPIEPQAKTNAINKAVMDLGNVLPEGGDEVPEELDAKLLKVVNGGEISNDEWNQLSNYFDVLQSEQDNQHVSDEIWDAWKKVKQAAGKTGGMLENDSATPDPSDEYTDTLPEHATAANLLNETLSSEGLLDFFGDLDMNASVEEKKAWLLDGLQGAAESDVTLSGPVLDAFKHLADALGVPMPEQETHSPMSPAAKSHPVSDLVVGDQILYNGKTVLIDSIAHGDTFASTAIYIKPVDGGTGKFIYTNSGASLPVTKKMAQPDAPGHSVKTTAGLKVGDKVSYAGKPWMVLELQDDSGGYMVTLENESGIENQNWWSYDENWAVLADAPAPKAPTPTGPQTLPASQLKPGDKIIDVDGDAGHIESIHTLPNGDLKVFYKVDDFGDQSFSMNVKPDNQGYFKKIGEGDVPAPAAPAAPASKSVKDYQSGDKVIWDGKPGEIAASEVSSYSEHGEWFLAVDFDDGGYTSGWVTNNPDGTVKLTEFSDSPGKNISLTPADAGVPSAPPVTGKKIGDSLQAKDMVPGMVVSTGPGDTYKVNGIKQLGPSTWNVDLTNTKTGQHFPDHQFFGTIYDWTLAELPGSDSKATQGKDLKIGDTVSIDGITGVVESFGENPFGPIVNILHGGKVDSFQAEEAFFKLGSPDAPASKYKVGDSVPAGDFTPGMVLQTEDGDEYKVNSVAPFTASHSGQKKVTLDLTKVDDGQNFPSHTLNSTYAGWKLASLSDATPDSTEPVFPPLDTKPSSVMGHDVQPGDIVWNGGATSALGKILSKKGETDSVVDWEIEGIGPWAGQTAWKMPKNTQLQVAKGGGSPGAVSPPEIVSTPSTPDVPSGTLVAGSTHVFQDAKGKYVINKKGHVLREGDKVVTKKGETGTISKFELDAKYAKVKMSDGKTKARQIDTLSPAGGGTSPTAGPSLYGDLKPGDIVFPAAMKPGMTLKGAKTGTLYKVTAVSQNPSGSYSFAVTKLDTNQDFEKTISSTSKGYLVPDVKDQPAGGVATAPPFPGGKVTPTALAPGKIWKQVDTVKSPDLVPGQVVGNDKKTLEYTKPSTKVNGKQEVKFVEDAEPLTVSKNIQQWQVWEQTDPGVIGKKKPEDLSNGDVVELADGTKHIFKSINAFSDEPGDVDVQFADVPGWHPVPENVKLTVWAQGTPLTSAPSTAEPVGEIKLTHEAVDFTLPEGGTVSVPAGAKVHKAQWWSNGKPVLVDGLNNVWQIDPATGTLKKTHSHYLNTLSDDSELFANANTADVEPSLSTVLSDSDLATLKTKISDYLLNGADTYWGGKSNFTALQKWLDDPTLGEGLSETEWYNASSGIGSPSYFGGWENEDQWEALKSEFLKARKKHTGTYPNEWRGSQYGSSQYHYSANERKALAALGLSDNASGLVTQKHTAPAANPDAAAEIYAIVSDANRASVIDDLFGKGTSAAIANKTRGPNFKPALSDNSSPYAKKVPDLPSTDGKNGQVIYLGDNVIASDGQGGKVQLVTGDGKVRVLRTDGTTFTRKGTAFVVTSSPVNVGKPNATQTGEAKAYVAKPRPEFQLPDWAKGNVGGTSTVTEALTRIKKSEKDGNIGWSFAGDGSHVEELDVRLQRVRNKQGGEFLEVRFKLTPKQGTAMFKRHSADPAWSESQMQVDARQVSENGKLAQMTGSNYHTNHLGRTLVKKSTNGTEIRFHRANSKAMSTSAGNPTAYHNLVQIRLPADATPSDIAKAMYDAGVDDPGPASPAAVRRLGENKLLSMFARKTDAWTGNDNIQNRETLLGQIKKEWGITADDLSIMNGTNGRFELRLPQSVADKIGQKTGVKYFTHSLKGGESDLYQKIGQNPFNALLASAQRELDGVIAAGQSKTADIYTGGADYVFTRPKSTMGGMLTNHIVYDAKRLFRRMDWFTMNHDAYGKREGNMDIVGTTSSSSTETMFKHRMDFDDAIGYLVNDESHRQKLIKTVKSHGITHFGSRTVEDFIIIAPNTDVVAPTPEPETIPVADLIDTAVDAATPSVGGAPA
jgi:hypothetical protein